MLLLAIGALLSFAALVNAAPELTNLTLSDVTVDKVADWNKFTTDAIEDCPNAPFDFLSTSVVGSTLTAKFTGTAVSLIALVDTDRGIVSVVLDNQPPTSVDATAGSTTRKCAPIWSQGGLNSGDHTLVVTVTRQLANSSKFEFVNLVVTPPGSSSQPPSASITTLPSGALPSNTNPPQPTSSAISPGAIAGIVVAVVALIGGAVVAFLFLRRRRQQKGNIIREPSFTAGGATHPPGDRPNPYPGVNYSNLPAGSQAVDLLEPTPYTVGGDATTSSHPPSSYPGSSHPASSYPGSNYQASTYPTSTYATSEAPERHGSPLEMAQLYPPMDTRTEAGTRPSVFSKIERPGSTAQTENRPLSQAPSSSSPPPAASGTAAAAAAAPVSEKARYEADRQRREQEQQQQQQQQQGGRQGSPGRTLSQDGTQAFLAGGLSEQEIDRIAHRIALIQTGAPRTSAGAVPPPAYEG